MDFRQLRYFVAVAEELHFGRAAQRLAISQPPLSFNIAKLEESLGFKLFKRSTREVTLTPSGQVIYREALKILALTHQARELGSRAANGGIGTIHVGFVGSALLTQLAAQVRRFSMDRPDVQVVVHELNSFEQINALSRRQIDFGVIHPRVVPTDIASSSLGTEPFICALPASHPLASYARVELSKLRHEDFILFQRHFSPEYYDKIVALCAHAGFVPSIRHEVRNMFSIVSLVANDFGVSLVPAPLQAVSMPNLTFRPLTHSGVSELFGIWREDDTSPLVQALRARLCAPDNSYDGIIDAGAHASSAQPISNAAAQGVSVPSTR